MTLEAPPAKTPKHTTWDPSDDMNSWFFGGFPSVGNFILPIPYKKGGRET